MRLIPNLRDRPDRAAPPGAPQARLRPASRRVVAAVLLIALTLVAGAAWLRRDMRAAQWADAGRTAQNLALGLERDITRVVQGYDKSLQHAAQAFVLPGFDGLPPAIQHALLFDSVALQTPNGMAVMGADGKPLFSSNHREYGTLEFGDRDWFQAHRDAPASGGAGLFVNDPVLGKLTSARNVPFSRRITGPDGSFRGVVVTTLQASFFQDLFDALRLPPQSAVSVSTLRGRVVARMPYDPTDFGSDVRTAQVFQRLQQARTGLYAGPGVVDGVNRLTAYRQVGDMPFVLTVGLSERDIYAPWYQTARVIGAVLALVLALAAGLAWTLRREALRRDAAERAAGEASGRLEQSDTLLRTIMETTPSLIYAKDRQGRMVLANGPVLRLVGRTWPEVQGRTDPEFLSDPVQAGAILANDRRIMEGGAAETVEEVVAPPGAPPVTWLSTKTPMRSADGAVVGLVGVSVDISERKQVEERQRLLLNELNHRVKNTLATVQAIAVQTLRGADPGLRDAFEGRLRALAAAHDVLTRESWAGADLHDVVQGALAPFDAPGGGRLDVSGPPLRLQPRAGLALGMALHELATNALKYGALSALGGTVSVRWEVVPGAQPVLRLDWAEAGGPPVAPPARRGFGSRLVERSLAQDLRGTARIGFDASGVTCQVEVPVAAVQAPGEAAPFPPVGQMQGTG